MKHFKTLTITLLIATLMLAGCGKAPTPAAEPTAPSEASAEVLETKEVEEVVEPVYTLQDCFGAEYTIIDDADKLNAFIDSYDGMTIRSYMTSRVYNEDNATDVDNSTMNTVFSYITYAGITTETDKIRTLKTYNVDEATRTCVPFEDAFGATLIDSDPLSAVYQLVINGTHLDTYYNNMFVPTDTIVTKDEVDAAQTSKTYRVVSDIPSDVVTKVLVPDITPKEIVMAQFSYDLEPYTFDTDTNIVYPSFINGMTQYVDENDLMTVVSLDVVLIPSTYAEVEEELNALCGCGLGCACGCDADPLNQFTFTDLDTTKYAKSTVNVRNLPSTDGEKIGSLNTNDNVHVTGQCNETNWYRFDYNGATGYCSGDYLVNDKVTVASANTSAGGSSSKPATAPNGNVLDYSQPNAAYTGLETFPYAEDGYVLCKVFDDGYDNVYFYGPSFQPSGFRTYESGNETYANLQKQARDIWYSYGHERHVWNSEKLPNGVTKHYLTD